MAYVLVNCRDTSKELRLSNEAWLQLRCLLMGAGWQPEGATGHRDIQTDTAVDVPNKTAADRFDSYSGCSLQVVSAHDVEMMAKAAEKGMSLCEDDPEGTYLILQRVLALQRPAAISGPCRQDEQDKPSSGTAPGGEAVTEDCSYVRDALRWFAEFARLGPFFID